MALPDGPDAVAAIVPLSEAARIRFDAYGALIRRWQGMMNLVAPSTLDDLWRRHFADGAQALAAAPTATRWLDIGSGGGLPGICTAILLAETPGVRVTLVESNSRKASFLQTVVRELKLPAEVLTMRIESAPKQIRPGTVEAVSARALAGLDQLLGLAEPWLAKGAVGVFHKGQDFASEVRLATQSWAFDMVEQVSLVDPAGRIAVLSNVKRRDEATS